MLGEPLTAVEPLEAGLEPPLAPEPLLPEPLLPEPVAPEPLAAEPLAPEPLLPDPLAPEPLLDVPADEPLPLENPPYVVSWSPPMPRRSRPNDCQAQ